MRSHLADEGVHGFGVGRHPLWGDDNSRFAHQQLSLFALFGQNDSDDVTGAARSQTKAIIDAVNAITKRYPDAAKYRAGAIL